MPDLSPRPLLATRADERLYEPRASADNPLRRALEHSRNTLVVGDRGSGRSSLLHKHARELRERDRPVVYLDSRAARDAVDLVRGLSSAIAEQGYAPAVADRVNPESRRADVLELLRALPAVHDLIVLLDDPPPDVAFELFGRHRDRLWELDYVWTVATTPDGAITLAAAPADAFFERRVDLFPLNASEKRRILDRRSPGLDSAAAATLTERGPDNLREFIGAASRIADGEVDPEAYARGVEERRRRAAAIGHSALVALGEVAALEPVSASDPRLLERLRWTKARASRVLNELLAKGLLEAESKPDGPGRPPKLYRTRPPEFFA